MIMFSIIVPADLVRLVRDFFALIRKAYPDTVTSEINMEDTADEQD